MMKATGMTRQVDELGRIVLPKEIRTRFDIKKRDYLEIFVDDGMIILKPYETSCIFCGSTENVTEHMERSVCESCISALSGQGKGK